MRANQPKKRAPDESPRSAVLGIGLDATDGHKRLTRGEGFVLAGGSEETHSQMQETLIKVGERLADRGKRIPDASPEELRDTIHDVSG